MNKKLLDRAFSITYCQMRGCCICGKPLLAGHAGRCKAFRKIWQINYDTIINFVQKRIVRADYTTQADVDAGEI